MLLRSQSMPPEILTMTDYTYADIAKMIDHSLLNPTLKADDLEAGCRLALQYDVASVCILPYYLKRCAELLRARERARCDAVDRVERAFLEEALARADNRPSEAARLTGMNRSQFARMLSRHGLSPRKAKK
jgi:DNA-binding NtrC family response regulator